MLASQPLLYHKLPMHKPVLHLSLLGLLQLYLTHPLPADPLQFALVPPFLAVPSTPQRFTAPLQSFPLQSTAHTLRYLVAE